MQDNLLDQNDSDTETLRILARKLSEQNEEKENQKTHNSSRKCSNCAALVHIPGDKKKNFPDRNVCVRNPPQSASYMQSSGLIQGMPKISTDVVNIFPSVQPDTHICGQHRYENEDPILGTASLREMSPA